MDSALLQALSLCADLAVDDDGTIPQRYLVDGRDNTGNASAVVIPRDVEEVRNVVRFAYDNDLRIVAQGARTGLVGGTVPQEQDSDKTIIMSLERLKSAPQFRKADSRVIVDAGFSLSEINEFLKPFGVCVAIDVSSDPMIGGMAATNIAGSRVLRYGDFRDMCEGIQVVFADEETSIYDTRNGSTKDNSKFNFTKVLVGSFGALGVITSVALKVYPIIDKTASAWIPLNKDVDLSELVGEIKSVSGQELIACEFISREALNALINSDSQSQSNVPVPYSSDDCDVVFVEWGSSSEEFQAEAYLEKTLMKLIEDGVIEDCAVVDPKNTWDLRHRLSEAVQHSGKKLIGCDISSSCDQVGLLRNSVRTKLASAYPDLIVCDFGHLGDGGFHMNIVVPKSIDWSDSDTLDVRNLVSEIAVGLGGSFSAEHGLGASNLALQIKFKDPATALMAEGLKSRVDPKNVLGHGGIAI